VTAQDDLKQDLAASGGQVLEPHVVDDQQFGFEVACEEAVFLGCSVFGPQVAHKIEDAAIVDAQAGAHSLHAEGLGEMALADAGRADQEHVAGVPDPLTGGQLHDPGARNVRIEAEVEVGKAAGVAEVGMPGAALDFPSGSQVDLVLEEQFEELFVRESVGDGFLEAQLKAEDQAAEAQGTGLCPDVG